MRPPGEKCTDPLITPKKLKLNKNTKIFHETQTLGCHWGKPLRFQFGFLASASA